MQVCSERNNFQSRPLQNSKPATGLKVPFKTGLMRRSFLRSRTFSQITEENTMDKDRIKGAAEQAKGKVKEVAGKVTGDSKLETEGKADQVAGKVQNTIGGIKDTLRGK